MFSETCLIIFMQIKVLCTANWGEACKNPAKVHNTLKKIHNTHKSSASFKRILVQSCCVLGDFVFFLLPLCFSPLCFVCFCSFFLIVRVFLICSPFSLSEPPYKYDYSRLNYKMLKSTRFTKLLIFLNVKCVHMYALSPKCWYFVTFSWETVRMGVRCLSGQIKSARLTLLRRKITFD